MEKHTPGPWVWVETPSAHPLDCSSDAPDKVWDGKTPFPQYQSFDELRGGGGTRVLSGFSCNDSTADVCVDEANARLIAAAPELLDSCFELHNALAAAARIMVQHNLVDEFLASTRALRIKDGVGTRAASLIRKVTEAA